MRDLHTNLIPVVGFRKSKPYWMHNSRQSKRKVIDHLSATPKETRRLSTEAEATVWRMYLAYKETFKKLFK